MLRLHFDFLILLHAAQLWVGSSRSSIFGRLRSLCQNIAALNEKKSPKAEIHQALPSYFAYVMLLDHLLQLQWGSESQKHINSGLLEVRYSDHQSDTRFL